MIEEQDIVARTLVIVQRNPLTGRALARCLAPLFCETLITTCPSEAEALLGAAAPGPIDLLCGQRFSDDDPPGVDWIARWRTMVPSLSRVALVSAEPPGADIEGIDAIFDKPVGAAVLQRFFSPPPMAAESRVRGRLQNASAPPARDAHA